MNRLIISIIAFLLVIIPASAQDLSDIRLDEMLNHATALQQAGKYSEAIDIFSEVVKYTEKSSTEKERQVYVICQILISSCYYDNEQYSEGYQVAKNMLNSSLSDEEKKVYRAMTPDIPMLAEEICKVSGMAVAAVMASLTLLEISGAVESGAGGYFMRHADDEEVGEPAITELDEGI